MKIKEFCEKSGLSRDTVRFYEKKGLLSPKVNGLSNQYREYGALDLELAAAIRMGQMMGFTLREMKDELEAWKEGTITKERKLELIDMKRAEVRARIADLQKIETYLNEKKMWIRKGEKGRPPVWLMGAQC